MSARQRRRIASAQQLVRDRATNDSDDSASDADDTAAAVYNTTKKSSAFLAFADSDSDSDDGGGGDTNEANDTVAQGDTNPAPSITANDASASSVKVGAPVRERKRAAAKAAANASQTVQDDDIALLNAIESPPLDIQHSLLAELLLVSERNLNADAEVTRLLGLPAAPAAAAGPGAGGRGVPQHLMMPAGGGRRKARYLTVNPEPQWVAPPTKAAGGFSMMKSSEADVSGGGAMFSIEYSDEFKSVQAQYEAVVAAADPQLIMDLLRRVPYHLDGLMQMHEYYRTLGQHQAAATFLRQAIFVFESAWHPSFRPWEASAFPCLLSRDGGGDVTGQASGDVSGWKLLTSYMRNAGRVGAPRAAYEVAKLLLQAGGAVGPGADPARVLLCLDYYAIRCGLHESVIRLTGGLEPAGAVLSRARRAFQPSPPSASALSALSPLPSAPLLTLRGTDVPVLALPNLMFSRALALFHLELAQLRSGGGSNTASNEIASASDRGKPAQASSAPAADSDGQPLLLQLHRDMSYLGFDSARMLVRALLAFPHALLPLLSAIGLSAKDTGYGPAAAAVAQASVSGSADANVSHPMMAPSRNCVWKPVFTSRLFAQPFAQLKRLRASGAVGPESDDDDDDDAEPRPSDTHLWTPQLEKLVDIFVTRHAQLWKGKDVMGWVFTAAKAAMAAHNAARSLQSADGAAASGNTSSSDPSAFSLFSGSAELAAAEANTAEALREEVYFAEPCDGPSRALKAALRHYASAVVSDYSDELTTIAADVADGRAGGGDDGFGGMMRGAGPRPPGIWIGREPRQLDIANRNPLWLLFESLLPWTQLPGAPQFQDAPLWGPGML